MTLTILQHHPAEDLGAIAEYAATRGIDVETIGLYRGEPLPEPFNVDLAVVLGGPMSVHDDVAWLKTERRWLEALVLAGRPMLGICLGAQQLAMTLGAEVGKFSSAEIGWWPVQPCGQHALSPPDGESFLHCQGEGFSCPPGAIALAAKEMTHCLGFVYGDHAVGLQFHPEASAAWLTKMRDIAASAMEISRTHIQMPGAQDYLTRVLDYLGALPRHNYARVDCGYYDHIELSIMRGTRRELIVRGLRSERTLKDARLLDTRTALGEEYVLVEGEGWLRADRLVLVGVDTAGSCRVG